MALARDNSVSMEYECLPQPQQLPDTLKLLEQELFSGRQATVQAEQSSVSACKADNPYTEIEQAAEEILHLVSDKGYRFRDITVAVRNLEEWGDRMERVFGRCQIPIFLSRMDDILQSRCWRC